MIRNLSRTETSYGYGSKTRFELLLKRIAQNRLYFMIMMFAVMAGIVIGVVKPGVGYEVFLNGAHIGYTHDISQVQNMMAQLDSDLRVAKGDDIKYTANISFSEGLKGKVHFNSTDELKRIISSDIEVTKPAYLVKTDSGIAFAVADKAIAEDIMQSVKEPYLEGKRNAVASIVNGVSLKQSQNVPIDKILNSKQAVSFINSPAARGVDAHSSKAALVAASKPLFDVKVSFDDTVKVPIKRGVTKQYDSSIYEGDSYVKSEGSDGLKSQDLRVTQINGVNIESRVIGENVINNPVNKVIVVGTKPSVPPILQTAYRYLGVPYVWGGTSPYGFDCSGLVQYVYAQHGIYLPRTSYEQINAGRHVSYSQLKPGDLVNFPGHVGIYIGGGQMIHAPRPGRSVCIESVFNGGNFICGTRILQ